MGTFGGVHRGASAPGKLMLAGEYAVLDGFPAVVTAVDARAQAVWSPPGDDGSPGPGDGSRKSRPPGPEALLARRCAEAHVAPVPMDLQIDVSALRSTDRKLGLGSSAAAAGAAAGAVLAYHGRDISSDAGRRDVLGLALEGHRAVAPEGSGADVAAAVLGGTLRFRRGDGPTDVDASPLPWPDGLTLRVVWTGKEARTSDMVARVNELPPPRRAALLGAIAEASRGFIDAFRARDADAVLETVRAHHTAMAALGDAAGAPIVEDTLDEVARLAHDHEGAAKPSGAGGGDVALAFFRMRDTSSQFGDACGRRGFQVLQLTEGAEGVRPIPHGENDADDFPSRP